MGIFKRRKAQPSADTLLQNAGFKEAFYNTPIGMVLLDTEGTILLCNSPAGRIIGAEAECRNKRLPDIIQESARDRFWASFTALKEGKQAGFQAEFPIIPENI